MSQQDGIDYIKKAFGPTAARMFQEKMKRAKQNVDSAQEIQVSVVCTKVNYPDDHWKVKREKRLATVVVDPDNKGDTHEERG